MAADWNAFLISHPERFSTLEMNTCAHNWKLPVAKSVFEIFLDLYVKLRICLFLFFEVHLKLIIVLT